ncbi:AraC family transcriptional regulator [Rhizobium sp. MC63]|uniref:AraC family transcriptional regulator n=1 Tax=Rhizobium mulingense TaxID=3031128 RepID=A0ACC6N1U2_9HYPH|nr:MULTISPECIES: AraC family transcriptional regulator [unclassified Rhizobium]MDF0699227.1 AraC family transcriptional regulator [Rhizobium sp. MC63]MEA3519546.1 AraC family transcriptional regulator [Rhizobium sp. MJ31]MEB3046091.1 AraC family transcriptional regulator [Rhizobium sp. MJ21]
MSVNFEVHAAGGFLHHPAAQSPIFSETAYSGTDPDALSEILSTSTSPIKAAAQANASIAYRCNFVSAGDLAIADCAYEGAISLRREAPSGKVIIFLPVEGDAVFNAGQEAIHSVPGRGAILGAGRATGARLLGRRRHLGLFVDQARINAHLTHMFERMITGDADFHPHIDLTAGAGLLLQQLVTNLHRGLGGGGLLQESPLAVSALCDATVYLLLENFPHRYSNELTLPAPAPAPRHVKWAIDFMHAHIAEPISLNEIATAAKVSIRTLQQGFRQFRNTTPIAYLHEIRMVAARRDLLESGAKQAVADIALRWGFTHLGRFAAEYKKRFGELPSQTLKR